MENSDKKRKRDINDISSSSSTKSVSHPKEKNLRRTLKSGIQLKKERKKFTKIKVDENLVQEPALKKRKLAASHKGESNRMNTSSTNEFAPKWTDEEYLAECENLSIVTARNIIELFNKENTIPFIARYRNDLTGNLKPDKLRKIKTTYEYIQLVHIKAEQLIKQISSKETIYSDLLSYIQCARTLEDLEFIGSQFKKGSKRSLAERARQLGLETPAKSILEGVGVVNLESSVNPKMPGLENIKKVRLGIQHIIADLISKNSEVHAILEKIYSSEQILLTSKFRGNKKRNVKDLSKYHLYKDFSQPLKTIRPHQTLAINRGESENELSVKIVIPDSVWLPLKNFCNSKWLKSGNSYELRSHLFSISMDDAIKRLLGPLAVRRLRAKLNAEAENEALYIFGSNLRQLLMTPPCIGHVVMGIDPGFGNGCKLAVVSHTGDLIAHDKFFLKETVNAREKLKSLILKHSCNVIALGNGTGCRETEELLSNFIKNGVFKPLNVSYTIVSEQGVSIYSCSSIAAEEFPDIDPKIVGAISLARRLQNPLSELVKVEPKHLGVGMYQHDVGEKRLVSVLDDIVSECVSFVGVDINSASFYLLKRIAGLSTTKAQEIIKYRNENCSFKCREDLKKVKGIKTKTFQQCAGFIRVTPSTARCMKHKICQNEFNPLDETCIHPESYEAAIKIINNFGLNLNQLGSEEFVKTVTRQKNLVSIEKLAKDCESSILSVSFIIDTLMKPKDFDLRSLSLGPIFRRKVKKLEELFPGQILEGIVRNTVTFGAFIDIGVGTNGLIHTSQMSNKTLQLNDRVKVQVMSIVLSAQRIELKLISLIK